jgi:hypothetical protein
MNNSDSTGIRFGRPNAHTVIPLCCPHCGSADLQSYQAVVRDKTNADVVDERAIAVIHYACGDGRCEARLMVRIERHAVSIKWSRPK